MNGADYIAIRRLTNRDGDKVFADPTGQTAPKTCEHVPAASLPRLLEIAWIRPAEPSEKPRRGRKEGKE